MKDKGETINRVKAHTYAGMNREARRAAAKKQGAFKHPGLFAQSQNSEALAGKTMQSKRGNR